MRDEDHPSLLGSWGPEPMDDDLPLPTQQPSTRTCRPARTQAPPSSWPLARLTAQVGWPRRCHGIPVCCPGGPCRWLFSKSCSLSHAGAVPKPQALTEWWGAAPPGRRQRRMKLGPPCSTPSSPDSHSEIPSWRPAPSKPHAVSSPSWRRSVRGLKYTDKRSVKSYRVLQPWDRSYR